MERFTLLRRCFHVAPWRVLLLLMLFSGAGASADGFLLRIVPAGAPETADADIIVETAQRAFIYYEGPEAPSDFGLETLILEVRTELFDSDFVWLIPLPYIPGGDEPDSLPAALVAVVDGAEESFGVLEELTALDVSVTTRYYDVTIEGRPSFGCGCDILSSTPGDLQDASSDTEDGTWNAEVWGSGTAGRFQYVHLSAESAEDIAGWLADNDFGVIGPQESAMVAEYIASDFSFVAITVAPAAAAESSSCVSLTFPSEAPFFPLKISRLGFDGSMQVVLFVCSRAAFEPTDTIVDRIIETHHEPIQDYYSILTADGALYAPAHVFSPTLVYREAPDVEAILAVVSTSAEAPLDGEWFWRDCTLPLARNGDADEEAVFYDPERFPFAAILQFPDGVHLSRFARTYRSRESLEDVRFRAGSEEEFRGSVSINVHVRADARSAAAPDLSFLLPLAFPAWVLLRKAYRRPWRAASPVSAPSTGSPPAWRSDSGGSGGRGGTRRTGPSGPPPL